MWVKTDDDVLEPRWVNLDRFDYLYVERHRGQYLVRASVGERETGVTLAAVASRSDADAFMSALMRDFSAGARAVEADDLKAERF